jgi:predicted HNH restriction endonuclease
MGKKKSETPRSRIKNAIRKLWLRSRERAKALKDSGHKCVDCGAKKSVAKGREVRLEVHHEPKIDWSGIVQLIFDRVLNVPQVPLCKSCHKKRHEKLDCNESVKKDIIKTA